MGPRRARFTTSLGWVEVLKRTAYAIYEDNCFGWAAELAYFWFLAPFPALLFVVALAAYLPVHNLIDAAVRTLALIAPDDVLVIVRDQLVQITQARHAGLLALSLSGALWSSSSGMTAIIDTLNQAYHVKDTRSWWRVRALAIALTLALATLALVSLALALAGPRLAQRVAISLHLGSAFAWTWRIAQWPLIFGLIVTALEWIYYFAPDVRHEWVWITPGSLTATTLGLVLSLGFRWYAGHFGDYQQTYGAIGGVIVALLWLYGSGLAILIGAELNATIEHSTARRMRASPRTPSRGGFARASRNRSSARGGATFYTAVTCEIEIPREGTHGSSQGRAERPIASRDETDSNLCDAPQPGASRGPGEAPSETAASRADRQTDGRTERQTDGPKERQDWLAQRTRLTETELTLTENTEG